MDGLLGQEPRDVANITDFGITAAKLNRVLNPATLAYSYHVGEATTGAHGTGNASGTWTDLDASWDLDRWNDFFLKHNNAKYLITDTAPTALTTGSSLNGLTGNYTIETQNYIETADATAVVTRIVGTIKSMLPEKYRRMLYRIEGEIIVDGAYYEQATADLTYTTTDTNTLHVWRNWWLSDSQRTVQAALFSPLDQSQGLTDFSDYTVSTAGGSTLITFQRGGATANKLNKGDTIIVDYDHALPTVPALLETIALHKSAYEILVDQGLGRDAIQDDIVSHNDRADALLKDLMESKIGIDEFDKIKLYEETRTERPVTRWGSAPFERG